MDKLLLFSDLHLGHPGPPDPGARLRAAFADAARNHGDAVHAVLMGDLTHHGAAQEYRQLAEALAGLPLPVTLMLGNHDRRDAFRAAFPEHPATGAGHVQTAVDIGRWRLLCLDTLDGPPWVAGRDGGRLCPARLGWLERRLAEAPDRPTLVFAHHPPMATGLPGMDRIGLAEGAELLALLQRHRQVRHLFCGHQHRRVSGSTGRLGWTVMPSTWKQLCLDIAGAGRNRFSVAAPGRYGVLLAGAEGVALHLVAPGGGGAGEGAASGA